MPNLKGGKKYKRQKKTTDGPKRQIRFKKEDAEIYGVVIKALGSCRFRVHCCDGKERLGQLRAGMKKSVRITKDDWVLVGLRTFETSDEKCDIICKYFPDEVTILKRNGELNMASFGKNNNNDDQDAEEEDENMAFDFEDI